MARFNLSKFFPLVSKDQDFPFVHRDLSWLQFNERVLAEAKRQDSPLLERVKFLAISASNLDEFFSIRVSALDKSIFKARRKLDLKKMSALSEKKVELIKGLKRFSDLQRQTLFELQDELARHSVFLNLNLQRKEPAYLLGQELYLSQVAPYLPAPERFEGKTFSSVESLQAVLLLPGSFGIRIPRNIPSLLFKKHPKQLRWDFFFLDHLLMAFFHTSDDLSPRAGMLRITRDGDYEYDLTDANPHAIPDLVKSRIGYRDRSKAIRIQTQSGISASSLQECMASLGLSSDNVFKAPHTLFLHSLWTLYREVLPSLTLKSPLYFVQTSGSVPPPFKRGKNFSQILEKRDRILHHPYDSFDCFVNFLSWAADDPQVTSIQQTIYRMDAGSPVLSHLKRAAKTKKVKVLIELRARFDEWNNLQIASELQKAGVQVFYGFGKLKLHAKVTLVTKKVNKTTATYTHLSTGNYHSATAKNYTDLALVTSDPEVGSDAQHFFDSVTKGLVPKTFKKLVVAPTGLSKKIHQLIDLEIKNAQAGKPARIFAKVNALVDEATIQSLYQASQAGVKVDLVVRGACSLVPGIPGISDKIRVISILDQYLEHSRIYFFESSEKLYLSSADWMPRNFLRRLEIAFPVEDPKLFSFIKNTVIPAYLRDTAHGKELTSFVQWRKRQPPLSSPAFRSQKYFSQLASEHYKGTPLE